MSTFDELLAQVRACTICKEHLPLGPKPIIQAHPDAVLLIVGQAPSLAAHESGVPWDDASGQRLRHWLQLPKDTFYDPTKVAIIPAGLCYPGRGSTGDLPPRKECAPQWHESILSQMPNIKTKLLVGQYSHKLFLGKEAGKTTTETVKKWRQFQPEVWPLPHPSPLNNIWLSRNDWFEEKLIPALRRTIKKMGLHTF